MSEIRHVVFDLGQVLVRWDPEAPYRRLIPDAAERRHFLTEVCGHDWNLEQDRGRRWEDAEALLVEKFPEREEHIRSFRKFWHEMVSHSYDDSVAIMVALIDSGYDVTMLTNFASDTFREAQKMFPFLTLPRGVTVSADVGLIKPDPAIYALHERSFGLERPATLFIDDNRKNIESAQAFGWNVVHFTNPPALRGALADHGIQV